MIHFPKSPKSKYNNKRVEIDGIKFASKREAQRYCELRLLAKVGEISGLECQPRYPLKVNGNLVCTYVADFRYRDEKAGGVVVEDVKSKPTITDTYRIKKKLMLAVHGVTVQEIF